MLGQTPFPTLTQQNNLRVKNTHTRTYQLLLNQPAVQQSSLSPNKHQENIFNKYLPIFVGEERNERPIGGVKLMKKMQVVNGNRSRKGTKSKVKIEVRQAVKKQKYKRVLTEVQEPRQRDKRYNSSIDAHEQILKMHKVYSVKNPQKVCSNSSQEIVTVDLRKINKQRREYMDRSAILGQIAYNKSINDLSGQRYFQHFMRDRWKDELKPPQFIYQLSKDQPFSRNKPITMLKKQFPHLLQRRKMVLQGRRLHSQQQIY